MMARFCGYRTGLGWSLGFVSCATGGCLFAAQARTAQSAGLGFALRCEGGALSLDRSQGPYHDRHRAIHRIFKMKSCGGDAVFPFLYKGSQYITQSAMLLLFIAAAAGARTSGNISTAAPRAPLT